MQSATSRTHFIKGKQRVLDLGCSRGYLTTWYALQDPSRTVHGVDVSAVTIERARRHASRFDGIAVEFFTGDLQTFLAGRAYDAIVSTQVLYAAEDQGAALTAIKGALRPAGILVAVEPHGPSETDALVKLADGLGLGLQTYGFYAASDLGEFSILPALAFSVGPSAGTFDDWPGAFADALTPYQAESSNAGVS